MSEANKIVRSIIYLEMTEFDAFLIRNAIQHNVDDMITELNNSDEVSIFDTLSSALGIPRVEGDRNFSLATGDKA